MNDLYSTNGPIEIRSIRQPLDYPAQPMRHLFDGMDEYTTSPLPGLPMILGVCASLIGLGAMIGYLIWSR